MFRRLNPSSNRPDISARADGFGNGWLPASVGGELPLNWESVNEGQASVGPGVLPSFLLNVQGTGSEPVITTRAHRQFTVGGNRDAESVGGISESGQIRITPSTTIAGSPENPTNVKDATLWFNSDGSTTVTSLYANTSLGVLKGSISGTITETTSDGTFSSTVNGSQTSLSLSYGAGDFISQPEVIVVQDTVTITSRDEFSTFVPWVYLSGATITRSGAPMVITGSLADRAVQQGDIVTAGSSFYYTGVVSTDNISGSISWTNNDSAFVIYDSVSRSDTMTNILDLVGNSGGNYPSGAIAVQPSVANPYDNTPATIPLIPTNDFTVIRWNFGIATENLVGAASAVISLVGSDEELSIFKFGSTDSSTITFIDLLIDSPFDYELATPTFYEINVTGNFSGASSNQSLGLSFFVDDLFIADDTPIEGSLNFEYNVVTGSATIAPSSAVIRTRVDGTNYDITINGSTTSLQAAQEFISEANALSGFNTTFNVIEVGGNVQYTSLSLEDLDVTFSVASQQATGASLSIVAGTTVDGVSPAVAETTRWLLRVGGQSITIDTELNTTTEAVIDDLVAAGSNIPWATITKIDANTVQIGRSYRLYL